MSAPWWAREAPEPRHASFIAGTTAPDLIPGDRDTVIREILARIASFTPEWKNRRPEDAGQALVRLFAEQTDIVLRRLRRLPEKMVIEYLRAAGVAPNPARAAHATLDFVISPDAQASVLIPQGFQVGAPAATGTGELVTFETTRDLVAAPAEIKELHVQERTLVRKVDLPDPAKGSTLQPFGRRAETGRSLFIGLSGSATPGPTIALGIEIADPTTAPPPSSAGSVTPLPLPPPPTITWEIFDGTSFKAAELQRDETASLTASGVVELRVPAIWPVGRPSGPDGDAPLRWVRLRIVDGRYADPPELASFRLNSVPVIAARTVRDEVLEPVPGSQNRSYRLSQTPILPRSLVLEIDEGIEPELDAAPWQEVDDLGPYGPSQRVFVVDPLSGTVTFGDGQHGVLVPPGFRHVRARTYQVGGGAAGAVKAGAIATLLNTTSFVTGATNLRPASGGSDVESTADAVRRGPQQIRARGRAVTAADYELLALGAEGADIQRAHAVGGLHPSFPGVRVPGVVGLFVVPRRRLPGVPVADQGTLRAVAEYLTSRVAPAGVEVVAAAPRFHRIAADVRVVIDPAADVGVTVGAILQSLDTYLHPLTGGADGTGWPFGGAIGYADLLRRLLSVKDVRAVPELTLVLDGVRSTGCADVAIAPHALLWPGGHAVVPVEKAS
ncbi:MAG: putative baseplate assembly protein [Vicinamibacterales bacterium]